MLNNSLSCFVKSFPFIIKVISLKNTINEESNKANLDASDIRNMLKQITSDIESMVSLFFFFF